jgi:hypothetical protein
MYNPLSVDGTVVQFVDFGIKILRGTYGIYKSTTGALQDNEELEIVTRDLALLAAKLRRPLRAEDEGVVWCTVHNRSHCRAYATIAYGWQRGSSRGSRA